MKFVNLTNRTINIVDEQGTIKLILKPSGNIVSANIVVKVLDTHQSYGEAVDVVSYEYGTVHGLPAPQPDTMYVVSYAVLQALDGIRDDVIAPDSSPASILRDKNGSKILGVRQFRKL